VVEEIQLALPQVEELPLELLKALEAILVDRTLHHLMAILLEEVVFSHLEDKALALTATAGGVVFELIRCVRIN
ncbi:unnamed protein product, partial [Nippostrongylus brasiliensis]|uniref:DUF445 family protein n=1 Tax=Nippostrongylus brasiliensis TaxID=27835 RepID=A0A0N4XRS0_NIPBR